MQPTLSEITSLARTAGEILMQHFEQDHQIRHKGRFDLVTEADTASETMLLREIRAHHPEHAIVTEESGAFDGRTGTWYIDPLDGTINYAHSLPIFCVSLAYAEGGQVQLGAVYDPSRDECYTAQRGAGAFRNGQPIHVSATDSLDHSLLVTGFPYNAFQIRENNLDNYANFARRTQGVRRLGSAALDLCYVADGRLDGYWEIEIKIWDIAAGTLIVEEAGGMVTDTAGDPHYLRPPYSVIAAGPNLHPRMLEVLRK